MCSLQSSGRGPASVNTYVHIDSVLSRSPVVGHRVRILFRLTRFRLLGNRSGQGPDRVVWRPRPDDPREN